MIENTLIIINAKVDEALQQISYLTMRVEELIKELTEADEEGGEDEDLEELDVENTTPPSKEMIDKVEKEVDDLEAEDGFNIKSK